MIEKYGKHRVRFVSINVGIVIENFYLVTTTLGLDIVALEGLSNEIEKKY